MTPPESWTDDDVRRMLTRRLPQVHGIALRVLLLLATAYALDLPRLVREVGEKLRLWPIFATTRKDTP